MTGPNRHIIPHFTFFVDKKAYWAPLAYTFDFKRQRLRVCSILNIGVSFLARACDVPVGRRSGGRLARMLVATINDIISLFFSFFFFFFSSPSSTFLIEGVLGSKNLFGES